MKTIVNCHDMFRISKQTSRYIASCGFSNIASHIEDISRIKSFIYSKKAITCISGAGISTGSGIPDYRGENGSYKRGHKPMVHQAFVSSELSRKRYWARSLAGFKQFRNAQPNKAHSSLVALEESGIVHTIISQNVDGLHQKAGSTNVIDLHGRNDRVVCLKCNNISSRDQIQSILEDQNKEFISTVIEPTLRGLTDSESLHRADGDLDLGNDVDLSNFTLPSCACCGGVLKPDVVFFGDSVPKAKVQLSYDKVESSDGILVIGTSLEVFSAYRFVLRAVDRNIPIVVINKGVTRMERNDLPLFYKTDHDCEVILSSVIER